MKLYFLKILNGRDVDIFTMLIRSIPILASQIRHNGRLLACVNVSITATVGSSIVQAGSPIDFRSQPRLIRSAAINIVSKHTGPDLT